MIVPKYKQVIAVRYANYNSEDQKKLGFAPGFVIYMKDINTILEGLYNDVRKVSTRQTVYTLVPLGLAFSMSLYLSYNFSQINKNLANQLENVRLLSEKTIEQEKKANKLEYERKIIEAENQRKTIELESAREMQLSLLPAELPQIENLDIACSVKTATEVGGDYFDFYVSDDDVLTAVVGDATGHGLKAGSMVVATKGLIGNVEYCKHSY